MSGANGSFPHFIGQLDSRLARIESTLDRIESQQDERYEKISDRLGNLEQTKAEVAGGWKVASVVGGVTGVIGSIATRWFSG